MTSLDHIQDKADLDDCKFNLFSAWAENHLAQYQFSKALSLYRDAYSIRPKLPETKLMYQIMMLFQKGKIFRIINASSGPLKK